MTGRICILFSLFFIFKVPDRYAGMIRSIKQNEGNPWLNKLPKKYYRRIKIGLKFFNVLDRSFPETKGFFLER